MSIINENYEKQEKAALLSFLFGVPGFIGLIVTIILTGSLVTLIDFLDSLCNLIRDGFICFLSKKLKNNLKYEFNYGVSRLETLSALCCDSIMVAGLIIVLCSSIKELFGPSAPSSILLFALICKVGAVATDSYMLYKQYKIMQENNTSVAKVAYAGALKNTLFDGIILIAYIFTLAFRNVPATYYMNPILCIGIAIVLGIKSVKRIIINVDDLIDKTLDEATQMKILRVINKYYDSYEQMIAINSHKIDELLFIDLELSFADDEEYEDIMKFKKQLQADLEKEIGTCKITINLS